MALRSQDVPFVPDAIIDHERCRARTEVGGVRRERRPNRLLSSRGRRESPVGLLWFDRHAQVFAIPGGERLGIARFEEYTAESKYLFHANPFFRARPNEKELSGHAPISPECTPKRAAWSASATCWTARRRTAGAGMRLAYRRAPTNARGWTHDGAKLCARGAPNQPL